jgi:UDP-glucose 4-epimerase
MTGSYEIYNLGTGTPLSVMQLVDAFQEATGVKLNYRFTPRRPGDVTAIWADPAKANRELGWKAERDIRDTLAAAWAWEKHLAGKD